MSESGAFVLEIKVTESFLAIELTNKIKRVRVENVLVANCNVQHKLA